MKKSLSCHHVGISVAMCCLIFICWWSSWVFCLDVNLLFFVGGWGVILFLMVTFHFEGDFFGQFGPELRGCLGLFGAVWLRIFSTKKKNDGCCNVYLLFGVVGLNRSKNPCFDHAYQPKLFFSQSLASSVWDNPPNRVPGPKKIHQKSRIRAAHQLHQWISYIQPCMLYKPPPPPSPKNVGSLKLFFLGW